MFEDSVSEDKCGIIIYEGKGAFYYSVFACFLFAEVQLRTKKMDDNAEIGPANHLGYEKRQEKERSRRKECYGSI